MTPTLFALLVCAGGLLASGTGAIYLAMVFSLFGAAAAVALPALGGATITPAVLFLPFLLAYALHERGLNGFLRQVAYPGAGFWLLLLALWGALSAYFLPRIFSGQVLVRTIDRNAIELGTALVPLHAVSTNITQAGYALGSVCGFVALRALLAGRGRLEHFRDAVLLLAGLNCLAGLINLAEFHFGLPRVLDYVRTGGYAIFGSYEEGGLMRISGTFPETSGFSAFTLPLFAFTFSLWLSGVRPAASAVLAVTSLALLLISTSGTAYVGLAIYVWCFGLGLIWRGVVHGRVPRLGTLMLVAWLALLVMGGMLLLDPEAARRVGSFFDLTVFNKLQGSSGIERTALNQQAWSNFLDTYGVGVGLGSARASSYALVLLSNVGVFGTFLFVAFIARLFRGDRFAAACPAVVRASRQAVLAALIAAGVSGAVFDLGLAFYGFAAAATHAAAVNRTAGRPALARVHGCA